MYEWQLALVYTSFELKQIDSVQQSAIEIDEYFKLVLSLGFIRRRLKWFYFF